MPDRIRNPLPIPEQCDHCASFDVAYVNNEVIYGRPCGDWPMAYYCSACEAAVGCHPGTNIPLGRMADKRTRQLRAVAHKHFDPLWRSGAMSRTEAYKLLSKLLNIPHEKCHISQLDAEQLRIVIAHCKESNIQTEAKIVARRKEKKRAKNVDRIKRDKKRTERFSKFTKRNAAIRRARRSEQDSSQD